MDGKAVMGPIAALILAIAAETGVPPYFALAIALEENSALDPLAWHENENGTADRGVMQLNSQYFDIDWQDPETNIRAGCLLLRELMGKPEASTYWMVACFYNAGYSRCISEPGPPSQTIEYAGRVMDRWNELTGGRAQTVIRKGQGINYPR